MMYCYFLRHGIASDREDWSGPDSGRPLTREGRDRMEREAAAIEDLSLGLDVIVTSPLVRAKQTAEIVADRLKMRDRLVEDSRLGLALDVEQLTAVLKSHNDAKNVLVVGHEPSMSDTIGRLIGRARVEFKKGALACVELADAESVMGTLIWLIPPKVLATFEKH